MAGRTRRFAIGITIFLLITAVALGGIFYVEHQEPVVTVTPDALVIGSPFYGDTFPMSDIQSVSLETSLPRIRLRTNGYALAGKLRGHFEVDDYGSTRMFVDMNVRPFVVVHTSSGVVVFNQEEPGRTQQIYQALNSRLHAKP